MAKKYISKINKEGVDIYMKDADAQERLSNTLTAAQAETLFNSIFNS